MHGETARAFLWATEPAAIAHGLEHARAAVKAGADDASAILAALLARAGQVEEAHRALVEPAPDEVSADGERFALGCIAEVLGLDERALAFYRQVGAAPSLSTASWRAIAAARIQAIEQRRGAAAAR